MAEVFEMQGMGALKESERKYARLSAIQGVILSAADHRQRPGLAETLRDLPLSMVDLGGKTLLERQTATLRACGVTEISVVTGSQSEKINAGDADVLVNREFASTGTAYSFLLGKQEPAAPCLLVYGDVVHDRTLVKQLLTSPHAITLVIDRAWRTLPRRDKAEPDLVFAEDPVKRTDERVLQTGAFKNVVRIGAGLHSSRANYEFAGIALFKDSGLGELRRAWEEAKAEFAEERFIRGEIAATQHDARWRFGRHACTVVGGAPASCVASVDRQHTASGDRQLSARSHGRGIRHRDAARSIRHEQPQGMRRRQFAQRPALALRPHQAHAA